LELLLNFNVNGLGAARDMGTSWRGFVWKYCMGVYQEALKKTTDKFSRAGI
jgi:hypothetical protein